MAVVSVATLTDKPDRYPDDVDQVARKAKAIIEKSGGKNTRCWPHWWRLSRQEHLHTCGRQTTSPMWVP